MADEATAGQIHVSRKNMKELHEHNLCINIEDLSHICSMFASTE